MGGRRIIAIAGSLCACIVAGEKNVELFKPKLPYGLDKFAKVPYGLDKFAKVPYGLDKFAKVPYGLDKFAKIPYGLDKFAKVPYDLAGYGDVAGNIKDEFVNTAIDTAGYLKDDFFGKVVPEPYIPEPVADILPKPVSAMLPKILPAKPVTILDHAPCSQYAKPQELTYVEFNPTKKSPKDVCKYLTTKFLSPFDKEHGKCKYTNPAGGYVDPYTNDGVAYPPKAPLGVTVVAKGSCSNIYFAPTSYTQLVAPDVDDYGKCKAPTVHRMLKERRRLDAAVDPHYGSHGHGHYPTKVYKSGFDYLLQCACSCLAPNYHSPKHGYGYEAPTYGHQEQSHGYGHHGQMHGYQSDYGQDHGYSSHGNTPSYGHDQSDHGYGQPSYGYGSHH